jgi:hypothetical protein
VACREPHVSEQHITNFGAEKYSKLSLPSSSPGFLLGLHYNPEDGGVMFI